MRSRFPEALSLTLAAMPDGLRAHVERVRHIAADLSVRHGLDAARVDLAAAAHDVMRAESGEGLLALARTWKLRVLPEDQRLPLLLHGPVGAAWLEREAGVEDPEVLEAVRWHTTGTRGMGQIALLVFVADKLDPGKLRRYPFQSDVRRLAQTSLADAALRFLTDDMTRLLRAMQQVHPEAVSARNDLLHRLA